MNKPDDVKDPIQSGRMSEHLIRLGKLLDHARSKDWNDAELGRQIGRSQQQINSWKDGSRRIGEKLARALEEKLGLARFALDDRPNAEQAHQVSEPPPRWGGLPASHAPHTKAAQSIPVSGWDRLGEMLAMNPSVREAAPRLETFAPVSSRAFFLTMRDDSMSPRVHRNDDLLFDPLEAPRAGDLVLIQTVEGEYLVRMFRAKTAHVWEAVAANEQYLPLSSMDDEITVVAVAIEHRSYLRRP